MQELKDLKQLIWQGAELGRNNVHGTIAEIIKSEKFQ